MEPVTGGRDNQIHTRSPIKQWTASQPQDDELLPPFRRELQAMRDYLDWELGKTASLA